MAKTIKIGGRLESVETGNIVAGANQIIDDDKHKRQSVINGEVDAELVRLDETKQDNLTFDNAPTEDSNNPVKSGGVYAADKLLSDAIEAILLLIPSAASALNKLVDMQTMNSSIATATATFRGTYNVVSDLELAYNATHDQIAAKLDEVITTADNNDYAFVQIPVSATSQDIAKTERYKFNGEAWAYEYDLNNSGFTQAQWNAINSTITAALVSKLTSLPTASELQTSLNGKQDNLTFDQTPTSGSQNPVTSGGIYARNAEIVALITALDTAKQDKLTFDSTPTQNSSNPVTSNGVYVAVSALQAAIVALDAAKQNVLTFDSTPTLGSNNPVTSSGIKTQLNRIDSAIVTLDNLYRALTQSSLVIVQPSDTWPVASPDATTIYRVVDRDHTPPQYYSDYMFSGSTPVLMAQYNNAIDDVPTAGSNNLVKSGGVYSAYNREQHIPFNWLYILTDEERKILSYIEKDSTLYMLFKDIITSRHFSQHHPDFAYMLTDDERKIVFALNKDGLPYYPAKYIHHPDLCFILTDSENKIIFGINKDGSIYYPDAGRNIINKHVPLIVDSDWGGDPDDAMALRVLAYMSRIGKSKTVLFNKVGGVYNGTVSGLDASFLFDGVGEVPILTGNTPSGDTPQGNYDVVAADFPHTKSVPDGIGTAAYRQYLAKQNRKVTFLTLGQLDDVSDLFDSSADQYSQLNGMGLIKEKVSRFVLMGGNYESSETYNSEYNFTHTPSATINVITKLKNNKIPTYLVGFDLVEDIVLGKHIDQHVPSYDLIRQEMEHCRDTWLPNIMDDGRIGADPVAALIASVEDPEDVGFKKVEGLVEVDSYGQTKFTEQTGTGVYKIVALYSADYYIDMLSKVIWKNCWI